MAEAKTQATTETLDEYLARSVDPLRHDDCRRLASMMREATGEAPVMWGAIVGFGRYRYQYQSGRTGEWPLVAFSPRKNDLTLYIMPGFDRYQSLLEELGKHKTGKSCLYIKRLADVDLTVLNALIVSSVISMAPKRVRPA